MVIKRLLIPAGWCLAIVCLAEILIEMQVPEGENKILWNTLGCFASVIPVLLFFYWSDARIRYGGGVRLKTGVLLFVGGALLSSAARMLFILSGIPGYEETTSVLFNGNIFLQVLALMIVAPIAEELFFRGILFWRLKEFITLKKAMVISAVCFGVYHGNPSQGIYGCFMGLILAWIMERNQTVTAPILLHMGVNAAALFIECFM